MVDITKPTDLDARIWASSGDITSPTTAEVEEGWLVGEKPPAELFNYWQNRTDRVLSYINQKGLLEWDTNTYYVAEKSICQRLGGIYKANTDSSGVDPATDTMEDYWTLMLSSSGAIPKSEESFLLDRVNHTGVQAISTITDLETTLATLETSDNKVVNFDSPNDTTYPTTLAVATLVAGGSSGGFIKTESTSNIANSTQTLSGGRAYDVDSSGGTFTLTLPITPAVGDFIWLYDVTGSWDTTPVTLGRNGELIETIAANYTLDRKYWSGIAVFIGGSYGWVLKGF